MSANKFILNGEVKIDLSQDTTTEEDVTKGKTFHKADGSVGVGTVVTFGDGWIGDGKTHLFIEISTEGRMDVPVYFFQSTDNSVTVDWGDGSAPETFSGGQFVDTRHTYANIGKYIITLAVAEGSMLNFSTKGTNYCFMGKLESDEMYFQRLKKVEIASCTPGLTDYTFQGCHSLSDVKLPNDLPTIGSGAFCNCYSLVSVEIPSSVKTVYAKAFYHCYGMKVFDFTKHTAVPKLRASDVFTGIPVDCEIRVPAALYDEWIATTNWSNYASKIVAV